LHQILFGFGLSFFSGINCHSKPELAVNFTGIFKFTLYEDENDNYNYEKGVYSTITFTWNNAKKELTINDRKGTYPGMLTDRKFNIVLVGKNKGTGESLSATYDKIVSYFGKKVIISVHP